MQFDNQTQKNLVVAALNKYPCNLGEAEALLRMAKYVSESPVVSKEHTKRKTDDPDKHDNKTTV